MHWRPLQHQRIRKYSTSGTPWWVNHYQCTLTPLSRHFFFITNKNPFMISKSDNFLWHSPLLYVNIQWEFLKNPGLKVYSHWTEPERRQERGTAQWGTIGLGLCPGSGVIWKLLHSFIQPIYSRSLSWVSVPSSVSTPLEWFLGTLVSIVFGVQLFAYLFVSKIFEWTTKWSSKTILVSEYFNTRPWSVDFAVRQSWFSHYSPGWEKLKWNYGKKSVFI